MPADRQIGRYRLISVVGVGGMGIVYRAEQKSPSRVVALKLIRPGLVSPSLLRRFEHEAEVLGRLQHPGIAAIYEAGAAQTPAGLTPYFAMEFVRGRELADYLAEEQPSPLRIAELFARICEAVQHAHTKGVIHRDLKPSNVLIDGTGQPKILDFGVARATDSDIQAVTVETAQGMLVGTVPYMSPEQVAGDAHILDTRSDVYTLGVLLFEALAGRLPHDLEQASIIEAARTISETDPLSLADLDTTLRGDLSTIAAKALEKDRERRYQTAADLAADLRRFVQDEPISARPASTLYQLRKFARRNKGLVAAAGAIALALVGVTVASLWAARVARREQNEAEQLKNFLNEMFLYPAPSEDGGDVRLIDVLADASSKIDERFADSQPRTAAELHERFGETLYGLGRLPDARERFERAHALFEATLGPRDEITRLQLSNMSVIDRDLGDLAGAAAILTSLVEQERRAPGDPRWLPLYLSNLGEVRRRTEDFDTAESHFREALALREAFAERAPPEDRADAHTNVRITQNDLALTLLSAGRLAEAEAILEGLLAEWRAVDGGEPASFYTLTVQHNLGLCLHQLDVLPDAEALQQATLERRLDLLGPDHPQTLQAALNLGATYIARGRFDTADGVLCDLLDRLSARAGVGWAGRLEATTRLRLADLRLAQGDAARSLDLAQQALDRVESDRARTDARFALGRALAGLGAYDEAASALSESADDLYQRLGPRHWRVAEARLEAALARRGAGESVDRAELEGWSERLAEAIGRDHRRVAALRERLP
ncbi:MAG: tetratricopeptide repeat protein [Planctomycetota bacterium]